MATTTTTIAPAMLEQSAFQPSAYTLAGATLGRPPAVSALVLADRLITLAQDADRAGFRDAASRLVSLVYAVLDDRDGHCQVTLPYGTGRSASQRARPATSGVRVAAPA